MNLTKDQREAVRLRYGGHCSYCGQPLQKKWHVDHLRPVGRQAIYRAGKFIPTGALDHPEHDHIFNLMPACIPCNIDKSDSSLEAWRRRIEDSHDRLLRNYSTYKHAVRFGMVGQTKVKLRFYFELMAKPRVQLFTT